MHGPTWIFWANLTPFSQDEAFLARVWRRAHASKLGQLKPVTVELDAPGKLGITLESLGQVRCPEFSPMGHPKFRTQN